jgi:hypothetical protein
MKQTHRHSTLKTVYPLCHLELTLPCGAFDSDVWPTGKDMTTDEVFDGIVEAVENLRTYAKQNANGLRLHWLGSET